MRTDHKTDSEYCVTGCADRPLERPGCPGPPRSRPPAPDRSRAYWSRAGTSPAASSLWRLTFDASRHRPFRMDRKRRRRSGVAGVWRLRAVEPGARPRKVRFYLEDTRAQVLIGGARVTGGRLVRSPMSWGEGRRDRGAHADEAGRVRLSRGVVERGRMPGFSAPDDIACLSSQQRWCCSRRIVPGDREQLALSRPTALT